MAGAGYKLFNTGDVLTAAQVNTYLMEQTVMRFATTTARDTALTGVLAEGMICYIDADNNLYKYTGSAWVNIDSGSTSPLTTKGDLYTYSTTDARLASSTINGDVLTVDTSTATGLKWAAPAGGGLNWTLLNTGGTALTGAATITVSGISNVENLHIIIVDGSSSNASSDCLVRFNTDSGSNYKTVGINLYALSTYAATNLRTFDAFGTSGITVAYGSNNAASVFYGTVRVDGCKSTGIKSYTVRGTANAGGGSNHEGFISGGIYEASAAITSVSLVVTSGNWDKGTVYIYGA